MKKRGPTVSDIVIYKQGLQVNNIVPNAKADNIYRGLKIQFLHNMILVALNRAHAQV